MDNETKNKISNLERQVAELESWKNKKEKQQITFPLDIESINILRNHLLYIAGKYWTQGAGVREFVNYIIKQGTDGFTANTENPMYTFVANTNDVLTIGRNIINGEQGSFSNDTHVVVFTDDTLPSPLSAVFDYYVISASGNTCKLSLSVGGSAVDITDVGTGTFYIQAF